MLDPRIYRAAFLPVVLAIIVTAFSLQDRPRPIGTTLAPDAFLGDTAAADLHALARDHPDRRPGSAGDAALAQVVARRLAGLGPRSVRVRTFKAQTIDGERDLQTVVATRPGAPGPGIVVVAHRDAAGRGAEAELSGTAAMLELARVVSDGRLRRTITFVSTSGGSGGAAGAAEIARHLPQPVDAVLVLGNVAGVRARRPFVTGFSNGRGQAPLRLVRTVGAAIKDQVGADAGAPRALTQWARLAFPLTVGEQGELARQGLGAVLIQASGERSPPAGEAIDARRLEGFGRAALRTVYALDNGPSLAEGPAAVLVTQRKVLPAWAVRLLVGALLLPPVLAAVDGFARVRRRREPVAAWIVWVLSGALPFAAAGLFALLLGLTGLLGPVPDAPVAAGALPFDASAKVALASIVLVFVLGWLLRRGTRPARTKGSDPFVPPGASAAVALVLCALALVVWVRNPYEAGLLVLPANVWLLVAAPEVRLPRAVGLSLVVLALTPLAAVAAADAHALGYGPLSLLWMGALGIGGGHIGVVDWLQWSIAGGCAVAAAGIAFARRSDAEPQQEVTVRGPISYAGPGSLGGTDSAMRR